jgi:hypothetical protein
MSNYALAFFSKRNDDGSIQYSSRIHSTLGIGSHVGGKIFEGELAFVQAVNSLKHEAGGVSRVISLLKTISSFDVPSGTPISDEQAVIFGWIPAHSAPKIKRAGVRGTAT